MRDKQCRLNCTVIEARGLADYLFTDIENTLHAKIRIENLPWWTLRLERELASPRRSDSRRVSISVLDPEFSHVGASRKGRGLQINQVYLFYYQNTLN